MGARADMRAQVPEGKRLCFAVVMRHEKGGPEGPPLLCGIIPAGRQAAMPGQFFQDQAFWKTSSPSRTSIRTA